MGLEFARQLAGRGYGLILVSNRADELSAAAAELQAHFPVSVTTRFQDLAQADAADRLFAWCREEAGVLPDVVINNAGMFFFKELETADLDRVQTMVNLHVVTVTRLCVLFGNAMKQRGSGYLLNMSSMAARMALLPISRCRTMFSSMTMASSTTRPMTRMSASRETLLRL